MRLSLTYASVPVCPKQKEAFVVSSGETDDLETYDLDYFTQSVTISAVFKTIGDTISVSEVGLGIHTMF